MKSLTLITFCVKEIQLSMNGIELHIELPKTKDYGHYVTGMCEAAQKGFTCRPEQVQFFIKKV